VVAVLSLLADLGFSQSTKVFAGRGESPRQLHSLLMRFAIGASLPLMLVFVMVMRLFGPTLLPNYPGHLQTATLIALPFFVYCGSWVYMMVGLAQIAKMNLVQVGTAAARLLLTIIVIVGLSMGLRAAVAIYVGTLLAQALAMAAIAASIGREAAGARSGLFAEMFRFGLRGTGGAIAGLVWQSTPVFVLNVLHGPAAVGVLSVAQQLVEKLHLPMEAVQDATFRRISRLPLGEAKAALNRYIRISGWLMGLLILTAGVVIPFAIVLVLGPSYAAAVPVVVALIPGALVMSTASLLATFFLAQLGKPGFMSIMASVALGILVALAVTLIPTFGATGAALAIAATQVIVTSLLVTAYVRTTGTRLREMATIDRAERGLIRARLLELWGARSGE
jgi:O-antigen/teichoic acid export membrane protein